MGVDDATEYNGDGVMPNTVYPKGSDALTASDKLRLQSITGQEEDSRAPVDPYHWYGNVRPNSNDERIARQTELAKQTQIRQQERLRYRETPLPY